MNLWKNYKNFLFETFSDLQFSIYTSPYILKSRSVEIWNEKTCIYNNIIYPRTGSDLPCFGMDLMCFFPKKVVITFDFQHPRDNYLFSVDELPKCEGGIRFFEPGNHFSENLFVTKCASDEIDNYLDMFKRYLTIYKNMIEFKKPLGLDFSSYCSFDKYMKELDPVAGYLSSKFGKEKSESLVNDFLFCYD
jgi:hypothetical protein